MINNAVANELSTSTDAVVPTAPLIESPATPEHAISSNEDAARRQQFPSQFQLHQIQQLQANHVMAQHQHQQQQHQLQMADIALNSEFVSIFSFFCYFLLLLFLLRMLLFSLLDMQESFVFFINYMPLSFNFPVKVHEFR